jgi:hypothetical protein
VPQKKILHCTKRQLFNEAQECMKNNLLKVC